MRKAQKQQAEELIKQIEEAHGQIKEYIGQGSVQYAMELLEDCQNGGITIGTLIEETQGEGHPTVALLEDYCELIYQIHADLADNHKETNANKVYKLLRQKLIKVENSLRNDVPVRTEAVFLPYKASMWDSLESVWKAADANPNCDAYVIPIPYYDKNPDGSFREMHYEGDQYPADVSITDYKEYDFEQRKPDMIYIHNPYDDLNYVTSVPPFFFSKNLKKYTEKLVYIPYFILGEIKPDEDERIEGMKHFVTTPGVFNADKVIVQSEDMKQVYIKVLLDATNDHSEVARKYWDNKILGTGSPKIDKVLNTKKEDLDVPQEWLKIIEKSDGSWKKIIFYNTSIGALLQHNEKMLEKMQYVLEVFRENQDEVALLWRPHPLIKATVESMRPQLWIEYDKLVRKYREEGWGIYDDSSDVDRAIVLSDAYYGDRSSVVFLCQKINKKYFIQNINVKQKNYMSQIFFNDDAIINDTRIWIASYETNALFEIEKSSGRIIDIKKFPNEKNIIGLFLYYVQVEDNIFFAPFNAENMWKYNIANQKFEIIDLDLSNEERKLQKKFTRIVSYRNKLFIFGYELPMIVEYDISNHKVIKYSLDKNLYCKGKHCKTMFVGNSCIVDNRIYLLLKNSNIIFQYNFDEEDYILHYIADGVDNGFATMTYNRGDIILSNYAGDEITWHLNNDSIKIEKIEVLEDKTQGLAEIIITKNSRIYFGAMEQIICCKRNDMFNAIEKIEYCYPIYAFHSYAEAWKYGFIKYIKDKVYFQERGGEMCILDISTMEIQRMCIFYNDQQEKFLLKELGINMCGKQDETDIYSLNVFLHSLFWEEK